jgi:hypothetical protein
MEYEIGLQIFLTYCCMTTLVANTTTLLVRPYLGLSYREGSSSIWRVVMQRSESHNMDFPGTTIFCGRPFAKLSMLLLIVASVPLMVRDEYPARSQSSWNEYVPVMRYRQRTTKRLAPFCKSD